VVGAEEEAEVAAEEEAEVAAAVEDGEVVDDDTPTAMYTAGSLNGPLPWELVAASL